MKVCSFVFLVQCNLKLTGKESNQNEVSKVCEKSYFTLKKNDQHQI